MTFDPPGWRVQRGRRRPSKVLMRVLFPGSPKGIEFNSVKEELLSVHKVKSIHCLRLWALTLSHALVSVHLAVGKVAPPPSEAGPTPPPESELQFSLFSHQRTAPTPRRCCRRPPTCSAPSSGSTASPSRWRSPPRTPGPAPSAETPATDGAGVFLSPPRGELDQGEPLFLEPPSFVLVLATELHANVKKPSSESSKTK